MASKYNRDFFYKGKSYYIPYYKDKYGRQKNLSHNQREYNKILKSIEEKIRRDEEENIGEVNVNELLSDVPVAKKKVTRKDLDLTKEVYKNAVKQRYTNYDYQDFYDDFYDTDYEEPQEADFDVSEADIYYQTLQSCLSIGYNDRTISICQSYLDEFYNASKREFVDNVKNSMDELKEKATIIAYESNDPQRLANAATHFIRLVSGGEYGDLPMDEVEEATEEDVYDRRYKNMSRHSRR